VKRPTISGGANGDLAILEKEIKETSIKIPAVQLLESAVSAERCPKPSKPLKQVEWCLVVNNKVWCNLSLHQCLKPSKGLSKWKWCSAVDKAT
jgi:hypothetical protein